MSDHYATLGVDKTASKEDIKKAYRRLAHKYHPDKKGGNEEKFKEVNGAYQVLSDDKKRSQYDQFGQTFEDGGAGSYGPFSGGTGVNFEDIDLGDLGDVFGQFFGRSHKTGQRTKKGNDVGIDIKISFKESAMAIKKEVTNRIFQTCGACHGNGAQPGTPIETCSTCQGQGVVSQSHQTPFGTFAQRVTCPKCHGEGKKAKQNCSTCRGEGRELRNRTLEIDIPAGIADGQTIRISGKGEAPSGGGISGDLFVTIHVSSDPLMKRDSDNVICNVTIPFSDAVLGTTTNIPTLEGSAELKIPPGTQPLSTIKIPSKGFPNINSGNRGDQIVIVNISIPTKLSRKQRSLIEQFKQTKKHSILGL